MAYDEEVETVVTENFKGVIRYSDQPDDPLDNFEFGTLTTWHRRERYGTPHSWESRLDFWNSFLVENEEAELDTWFDQEWKTRCEPNFPPITTEYQASIEELQKEYRERVLDTVKDRVFYLTVFMYDHSGVTVSSSPFSCPWDSGQLGYLWISAEEAFAKIVDFGFGGLSREDQAKQILHQLEEQLKVYDMWLQNDVYDVYVSARQRCGECSHVVEEIIDGCSEIYGFEHAQEMLRTIMAACAGGTDASQ